LDFHPPAKKADSSVRQTASALRNDVIEAEALYGNSENALALQGVGVSSVKEIMEKWRLGLDAATEARKSR